MWVCPRCHACTVCLGCHAAPLRAALPPHSLPPDPSAAHHPGAHARGVKRLIFLLPLPLLLLLLLLLLPCRAHCCTVCTDVGRSQHTATRPACSCWCWQCLSLPADPAVECLAICASKVIGGIGAMDSIVTVDPDPQTDLKHVREQAC